MMSGLPLVAIILLMLLSGCLGFALHALARGARALGEVQSRLSLQLALLDTLPVPVYIKDIERRFVGCNKAFTAFTGLDLAVIQGRKAEEFSKPELSDVYRRTDEELLKTGGYIRFAGMVAASNGIVRPVEFFKALYCDASGHQLGFIGGFFDLSERVQSENEMRSMLTTRDSLLAILSHDLLNPIWGMKKALELEDRPFSVESAELFASEYSKTINRIYNLLENLLGWARLQWRDMRVEPADFDLMSMLQDELTGTDSPSDPKGYHRLRVTGPAVLKVRCDRNLLSILIRNVVTNALKYSPETSLVDLIVEPVGMFLIRIEDRGPGIKASLVEALFKGEHILESGSRSGHGFGLPLCRDIAKLMGCEFRLSGRPEGGTQVVLSIP